MDWRDNHKNYNMKNWYISKINVECVDDRNQCVITKQIVHKRPGSKDTIWNKEQVNNKLINYKIDSSNMQKPRKEPTRGEKYLIMILFIFRRVHFLHGNPIHPPEKVPP